MSQTNRHSPFACVMDAIDPEKRSSHIANTKALFNGVREIREQDDGYAFRFDNESTDLARLMEFIELERLCCPFFGFTVVLEPEGGAVWLKLTGRDGVKAFIQAEIGEIVGRPIVATQNDSRSQQRRNQR